MNEKVIELHDPPGADLADDILVRLPTGEVVTISEYRATRVEVVRGGPGSGYHRPHFGIPGKRGGSLPRAEGLGLHTAKVGDVTVFSADEKMARESAKALEHLSAELGLDLSGFIITDNNEYYAALARNQLNAYHEAVDERLEQAERALQSVRVDNPAEEILDPYEEYYIDRWRYIDGLSNVELLEELNRSVGGLFNGNRNIIWLNASLLAQPGSKGFTYTLWHEVAHFLHGDEFETFPKGSRYGSLGRDRYGVPWKYSERVGSGGAYVRNNLGYKREDVPREYFADLTAAYLGNSAYNEGEGVYKFGRRFGWRRLEDDEMGDMQYVVDFIKNKGQGALTERSMRLDDYPNVIVYYPQGDGTYEGIVRGPDELDNLSPGVLRGDRFEDVMVLLDLKPLSLVRRGGPGSGHHGHKGRPGEVGGSLPSGVSGFDNNVTDAYSGQVNGTMYALDEEGNRIGYIDWVRYGGEVSVSMVEVDEAHRRKGIATAMWEELQKEFPDDKLVPFGDVATEAGQAFLESLSGDDAVRLERYKSVRSDKNAHRFLENTINERLKAMRSRKGEVAVRFGAAPAWGEDAKGLLFTRKDGTAVRADLVEGDYDSDPTKITIYGLWASEPGTGLGTAAMYGLREYAKAKNKSLEIIAVANHGFFKRFPWLEEVDAGTFRYDPPSAVERGGPGSGHRKHKGRPGEVGGSLPSGGRATVTVNQLRPAHELSARELAQRIKAQYTDEDPKNLYGRYVNARDLKPDIDNKEFQKIFSEVEPMLHEIVEEMEVDWTHYDELVGEKVAVVVEEGGVQRLVWESGKIGSNPPSMSLDPERFKELPDDGPGKQVQHQAVQPAEVKIAFNSGLDSEARSISTDRGLRIEIGEKFFKLPTKETKAWVLAHEVGHEIVDRYFESSGADYWKVSDSLVAPSNEQWGGEFPNFVFGTTRADEALSESYSVYMFEGEKPFRDRGGSYLEALEIIKEAVGSSPELNFTKSHFMEWSNELQPDATDDVLEVERGGPGSGHRKHKGRPGEVGGSLPSGQSAGVPADGSEAGAGAATSGGTGIPQDVQDYIKTYDAVMREGETELQFRIRMNRAATRLGLEQLENMTPDEILSMDRNEFNKMHEPFYELLTGDADIEGLDAEQKEQLRTSYIFGVQSGYDSAREFMERKLVASGLVSPDDNRLSYTAKRPQGGGEWVPLPEKLYHVTTAADAVRADRLKSRFELELWATKGLGGGEDDTISFSDDLSVAQDIDRALHEGSAAARGDFTIDTMVRWAAEGRDAPKPYLGFMVALAGGYNSFTEEEMAEIDNRVAADPTDIPEEVTRIIDRFKSRDEEYNDFEFYQKYFGNARQHEGGPTYPLFWGVDKKALAESDPSQFTILELTPSEGAMGYQMGGLGEWRTVGGENVQLVGEHETMTADDEEEYFAR